MTAIACPRPIDSQTREWVRWALVATRGFENVVFFLGFLSSLIRFAAWSLWTRADLKGA